MFSTSTINIELLVITITSILFLFILAISLIYLYNIIYNKYIYINTLFLLYPNEIKIIFYLIIFISLVIYNSIGILMLDNKYQILLNFLANINKDDMWYVDYIKDNNIPAPASSSTNFNHYQENPSFNSSNSLVVNGTNDRYRLNGGELIDDYICIGNFDRFQGTNSIDYQNYNETTVRVVSGLSHSHEVYTVIVKPNNPNSFSLLAKNILVNDNPTNMSVGEAVFNNLENKLLTEHAYHIPPKVNGSFTIELKGRINNNTLQLTCYL